VNRHTTGCRGKTAKPAYLASGELRAEESIAPDPARDSARWDGKTPSNAVGPLTAPSGHLPTLAVLLRMLPSRPGRRQGRRRGHDEDEGEQRAAVAQPGSKPEAVERLIRAFVIGICRRRTKDADPEADERACRDRARRGDGAAGPLR
jgi:hypothetical protein